MKKTKPIIAFLYDFDKTLCTKDMQEYTFIPDVNMTAEEFWVKSNTMAEEHKMDRILAYMYTMLKAADSNERPIKRKNFEESGKDIEYFPGVEDWFPRINSYVDSLGAVAEHYIISSGLKEIIEGSTLGKAHCFKKIYACEFFYDVNEVARWPLNAVNYTGKTQYLFRINKGILDVSEDEKLNEYTTDDERRIPFRNMMYFGDGLTDVPCMKLVRVNGGKSIAVYPEASEIGKERVQKLLADERVNFYEAADYRENSPLDTLVKKIAHAMVIEHELFEHTQDLLRK